MPVARETPWRRDVLERTRTVLYLRWLPDVTSTMCLPHGEAY